MAYVCDLGAGQRVYLDNQGMHTLITLASSSVGQQQQSSSMQTGHWTAPPQVFRTGTAIVVQIQTAEGKQFMQMQQAASQAQATNISLMDAAPADLVNPLPMQQTDVLPDMQPMSPMKPMQPIQPMQMGNMSMSMNPMSMRMGDMEMQMGSPNRSSVSSSASSSASSSSTGASHTASETGVRQFCSQCGAGVQPTDRFCARCGTRLTA